LSKDDLEGVIEMGKIDLGMRSLAVVLGLVLGIHMLLLAYLDMFFGIGEPAVALLGSLYIGFNASYVGGLMGLLFGFIHGYILGALFLIVSDFIKGL